MPQRWMHLNHPNMSRDFIDRDGDGRQDGGFHGLELLIDAAEAWGDELIGNLIPRRRLQMARGVRG